MANEIQEIFTHTFECGFTGTLGADKKGKLYWNDKEVVIEQKITLDCWVNVSIIIASGSTLVMAIIAVCDYLK